MARRPTSDPMIPDEREKRLVSWARQTIEQLRRQVTSLRESVAATNSEHADSEVSLVRWTGLDFQTTRLPAGSKVRFAVANPHFPEKKVDIEVWVERCDRSQRPVGRLIVNSHGGALNIVPGASNQIMIDLREF